MRQDRSVNSRVIARITRFVANESFDDHLWPTRLVTIDRFARSSRRCQTRSLSLRVCLIERLRNDRKRERRSDGYWSWLRDLIDSDLTLFTLQQDLRIFTHHRLTVINCRFQCKPSSLLRTTFFLPRRREMTLFGGRSEAGLFYIVVYWYKISLREIQPCE